MEEIVIVGAARTPIGKFGGSLAKIPAAELGALVIRKALERAGIAAEQVSEVLHRRATPRRVHHHWGVAGHRRDDTFGQPNRLLT